MPSVANIMVLNACGAQVRKYAVDILERVSDQQLRPYLLQLTQCLKFEPYHSSPLSTFLVERSLQSVNSLGHFWFWHMRAEMLMNENFRERCTFILEEYFRRDYAVTDELSKQLDVVSRLQKIAETISSMRDDKKDEIDNALRSSLRVLNQTFFNTLENGNFQCPLDPSIVLTNLSIGNFPLKSIKLFFLLFHLT